MEKIQVKVSCQSCDSEHTLEVYPLDYEDWQNGKLIQLAMPYLLPAERELLISKTCDKCFQSMSKEPVSMEIEIDVKNNYGTENYYVTSSHKSAISTLTGKKTIDLIDMQALSVLGFTFQFTKQLTNEAVKKFMEGGVLWLTNKTL